MAGSLGQRTGPDGAPAVWRTEDGGDLDLERAERRLPLSGDSPPPEEGVGPGLLILEVRPWLVGIRK